MPKPKNIGKDMAASVRQQREEKIFCNKEKHENGK
ncbi:hypothetical protein C8R32_104213 [Nitrosospira sp. Nsp5]|nr:hypothetical protein C8R32_104213 [Nitrosospira sp. Nsp5]